MRAARAKVTVETTLGRNTSVSQHNESIELAIIGDDAKRLALLRQEISRYDASCEIRTLDASQAAFMKHGPSGQNAVDTADVLLIDFAGPETATLSWVQAIACGRKRARTPVVIMTSDDSEELLRNALDDNGKATMFSPTPFSTFMVGLLQKNRDRLLKALNTLYQFGPILVRLPSSAVPNVTQSTALSA